MHVKLFLPRNWVWCVDFEFEEQKPEIAHHFSWIIFTFNFTINVIYVSICIWRFKSRPNKPIFSLWYEYFDSLLVYHVWWWYLANSYHIFNCEQLQIILLPRWKKGESSEWIATIAYENSKLVWNQNFVAILYVVLNSLIISHWKMFSSPKWK